MFEIAAHRGGNSWPSILNAIEKKYDYIELDVHLSCDNYLIVQYSPKIQIRGEEIYIQHLKYNSLPDEEKNQILLLSDILVYVKDKIGVIIDIKRGLSFYKNIEKKIADLINDVGTYKKTWLISFDHKCLMNVKEYNINVKIAPMYVARLYDEDTYWNKINADGIEICNDYLLPETVTLAHKNNLKLLGWCTKELDELSQLVGLGIDIITIEQNDYYLNFLNSIERK